MATTTMVVDSCSSFWQRKIAQALELDLLNPLPSGISDIKQDRPLPKFGEWDVNNPASAEGFTVIFSKARDEKKGTGPASNKAKSPVKNNSSQGKNNEKKTFCCF